jgi:hypothetical protein
MPPARAASDACSSPSHGIGRPGLRERDASAVCPQSRSAALWNRVSRSRKLYGQFFELWKDADPDVPLLVRAQEESKKIQ